MPASRPRITRAELVQLMNDKLGVDYATRLLAAEEGKMFAVMIPGYYGKSMGGTPGNDRGVYDDCMVVVSPTTFATFNANTDPSVFRNKTKSKQGIATLKPGVHPFKPGNHGISRPGGGYPAFRPATKEERLPVFRDGDPDENAYGVATNIHKGGYNGTSSEGCQTIFPDQWAEFYAVVMGQLRRTGQKQFNLIKLAA